jgi:hypothetical protein
MTGARTNSTYVWDIFLSYPRRPLVGRWVAEVFHPQVHEGLQIVGLGRNVSVFRDEIALEAGAIWPERLSEAHASSRVVLAVLCYPYFESRWCCSEWRTASARDRYRQTAPIVPVRFNDLEPTTLKGLPGVWRNEVAKRQSLDLREYSGLVNRLADTELALRFRNKISSFCEEVLKPAILGAPPRSLAWPKMPSDPALRTRPAFRARLGR